MHRCIATIQLAALTLPAVSLVPSTWELDRSIRLLSNVKRKTSGRPLDLLEDLYDRESGLTGEGVWHNAHFGAAQLLAARRMGTGPVGKAIAAELRASAQRLGDSLYDLNWDQGFRLRTASGMWKTPDAAVESGGERPGFYEPSRDRRCVSNAAAVIFYSLLDDDRIGEIGETFLDLFFDDKLGRFRRGAVGDSGEYWRSVDQAMAILACKRLGGDRATAAAAAAATALRRDFGYRSGERPINHLGPFPGTRRRNSWHDSFAIYALALDGDVSDLVDMMRAAYESADNGLLAHQAHDAGTSPYLGDGSAVHFSCTQAVWGAVGRLTTTSGEFETHDAAWRSFDAATSRDGLFVVADAYPNVRLWCNTEPAFWLLVEPDIFTSNSLS